MSRDNSIVMSDTELARRLAKNVDNITKKLEDKDLMNYVDSMLTLNRGFTLRQWIRKVDKYIAKMMGIRQQIVLADEMPTEELDKLVEDYTLTVDNIDIVKYIIATRFNPGEREEDNSSVVRVKLDDNVERIDLPTHEGYEYKGKVYHEYMLVYGKGRHGRRRMIVDSEEEAIRKLELYAKKYDLELTVYAIVKSNMPKGLAPALMKAVDNMDTVVIDESRRGWVSEKDTTNEEVNHLDDKHTSTVAKLFKEKFPEAEKIVGMRLIDYKEDTDTYVVSISRTDKKYEIPYSEVKDKLTQLG
ncbi:hypothetical protein SP15_242 [Bacillus phage SP-15]|uniref:Uncharacterized protein n=1 Tax=Bacillus phage SP-15 TaxID=1792032 RepID=A0A127AWS7_9CAUD|nr:hypothetical protein SP15_242 [Bacillus phage SP-15]AMM45047.1 hypothetical protein SP15_242 [Bacillus phage SP-15]